MARRKRTGNEKKLTVEIDGQLLQDFHIYARKHGTNVTALIEGLVRETLELAGIYSSSRPYRPLVERMVGEGKHTRAEIVDIVCDKIPGTKKDTVKQFLTDAKTARLLHSRVIEGEPRRCLSFGEPWESQADDHGGHGDIENEEQTGDPPSNQG